MDFRIVKRTYTDGSVKYFPQRRLFWPFRWKPVGVFVKSWGSLDSANGAIKDYIDNWKAKKYSTEIIKYEP